MNNITIRDYGWDLHKYEYRRCNECCRIFFIDPLASDYAKTIYCPLGHKIDNNWWSSERLEKTLKSTKEENEVLRKREQSLRGQITKLKKGKK